MIQTLRVLFLTVLVLSMIMGAGNAFVNESEDVLMPPKQLMDLHGVHEVREISDSSSATPLSSPSQDDIQFTWSGSVTLAPGETFTVVPFNDETTEYVVNRTSALGALDAASVLGEFEYTIQKTDWGPFLYSIDEVVYNPATWDSWLYQVNGESAQVGFIDYELEDGDLIELWYGAWGSTPETADHVVTITARIQEPEPVPFSWSGSVTLAPGETFTVVPFNDETTEYVVNRTSALGALDAASVLGEFEYTIQKTDWGPFLYSIDEVVYNPATWDSWLYQVNGESAQVGFIDYELEDGDLIELWYGAWGSTPETADHVVTITVMISGDESDPGDDPAPPINQTILWKKDLQEFIGATPLVTGNSVIVGVWPDMVFTPGEEYHLFSLDAETGEEIWRNPLGVGEGTVSSAELYEGRILVGCMDGRLYAIDAGDGTTLWSKKVEKGRLDDGNWHGLSTSPVVHDAIVYVNTRSNGTLHAFSVDGEPLWSYVTGNQTFVYSSPAYAKGTIFFAGHTIDHVLVAVNASSGNEIWTVPVGSQIRSTPVIDDEIVYVTTTDSLYAFHATDGALLWILPISGAWSSPAVTDGRIYLGTNSDHALHCIDAISGEILWTFNANGKVDSSPAVADGVVYFATNTASGTIYAVTTDGEEIWRYQTTNYIMSSPAIIDGRLYIGTDEGFLYAFGDRPEQERAVASFTPNSTRGMSPLTVQFTDTSAGSDPLTWLWDFGDGNTSTDQHPSHIFMSAPEDLQTRYNVTLTVGNPYGPDSTAFDTITVISPPQAFAINESFNSSTRRTTEDIFLNCTGIHLFIPLNTSPLLNGTPIATLTAGIAPEIPNPPAGTTLRLADHVYTLGPAGATFDPPIAVTFGPFTTDEWATLFSSGITTTIRRYDGTDWIPLDDQVSDPVNRTITGHVSSFSIFAPITVSSGGASGGGGGGSDSPALVWRDVTLSPGTFSVTAGNSGKTYQVSRMTAFGALHASGVPYTIDDSYYGEYGSLFINGIEGRANSGTQGWMYQVNGVSPAVGANVQTVQAGDTVVFFWSEGMSSTPATSPHVIPLRIRASGSTGSSVGSVPSTVLMQNTIKDNLSSRMVSRNIYLMVPFGVEITRSSQGQNFRVDQKHLKSRGADLMIHQDSVHLISEGVTHILKGTGIREQSGVIFGNLEEIRVEIDPIDASLEGVGYMHAGAAINLALLPEESSLIITFYESPDDTQLERIRSSASQEGYELHDISHLVSFWPVNLVNTRHIKDATVSLSAPSAWVHGEDRGDKILVCSLHEDGSVTFINPEKTGSSEDTVTYSAYSPDGLSTFAIISVREKLRDQVAGTTPVRSSADPTEETRADGGSGPSIVLVSVLLIGGIVAVSCSGLWYTKWRGR